MAKVRVYELAKELNMESKELVEKLKANGVDIKNYMSTLDDAAVAKARDIVSGAVSEVIEEKRIKPTVIRRRKKTVKVEKEKPELKPVEKEEEKEIELKEPKKAPKKRKKGVEPVPEKVEEEVKAEEEKVQEAPISKDEKMPEVKDMETSEEAGPVKPLPTAKVPKKAKKAKRKKMDQPAKIIKRPEEGPLQAVIAKKKEEKLRVEKIEPESPSEIEEKVVSIEEGKEKPLKRKKDRKKVEKGEATPKGIIRHRKLEVFERADLYEERQARPKEKKALKRAKAVSKKFKQTEITTPKAIKRRIRVQEKVTVAELGRAMGPKSPSSENSSVPRSPLSTNSASPAGSVPYSPNSALPSSVTTPASVWASCSEQDTTQPAQTATMIINLKKSLDISTPTTLSAAFYRYQETSRKRSTV